MRICTLVLAVAVISTSGVEMRAQMSGSPPPVGTKEDPAKAVDGLISMMESEVVGAAKAMPAEKYNFAPSQGIFAASQTTQFDTVRTFVAQVTHLAGELLLFRPFCHVCGGGDPSGRDDADCECGASAAPSQRERNRS